jgi:hypothetical protein
MTMLAPEKSRTVGVGFLGCPSLAYSKSTGSWMNRTSSPRLSSRTTTIVWPLQTDIGLSVPWAGVSWLPFYARWYLILVISSLEDPIRDCYNRYLTLPTLGWLQYTAEVYNLHMTVRGLLKRLDEVRKDIEVCCQYIWSSCLVLTLWCRPLKQTAP